MLAALMPIQRPPADRDPEADRAELKALRKALDRSQDDLARDLDVSSGTVWKWEAGWNEVPWMVLELLRCRARERGVTVKVPPEPTPKRRTRH